MKQQVVLAVAMVFAAPFAMGAARAPVTPTPERGARAFYDAYVRYRPLGIPDAQMIGRLAPFVTARLRALLVEGDRAEARYAEAMKNEVPPLVEGDLFTSLFEGATKTTVGPCRSDGNTNASCTIVLTYTSKGERDVLWTDTVMLVREDAGYRVDDVVYGGTWAFGNKGRLSAVVNGAIAESRMPVD